MSIVTVHIDGDVNSEMREKFFRAIQEAGSNKLRVFFATYGGDVYSAIGIYQLLRMHGNTEIICHGEVMSAGVVILQGAKTRAALELSLFMVHYGDDSNSSLSDVKHNIYLTKLMTKMIHTRSKVTLKTINGWLKANTYFTAQEALKVGLIDTVISVPLDNV